MTLYTDIPSYIFVSLLSLYIYTEQWWCSGEAIGLQSKGTRVQA